MTPAWDEQLALWLKYLELLRTWCVCQKEYTSSVSFDPNLWLRFTETSCFSHHNIYKLLWYTAISEEFINNYSFCSICNCSDSKWQLDGSLIPGKQIQNSGKLSLRKHQYSPLSLISHFTSKWRVWWVQMIFSSDWDVWLVCLHIKFTL